MTMSKRTLSALKASIRHWEENAAASTPQGVHIYGDRCPLCALYAIHGSCSATCPVKGATGKNNCEGSPWEVARDAFWKRKDGGKRITFRAAAQAEVDFLKSLLPKGHKP